MFQLFQFHSYVHINLGLILAILFALGKIDGLASLITFASMQFDTPSYRSGSFLLLFCLSLGWQVCILEDHLSFRRSRSILTFTLNVRQRALLFAGVHLECCHL